MAAARRSEQVTHIRDLTPDRHNRRKHNPRNVGVIADSLQDVGAGRSIVIDENDVVLAGNATIDAAAEVGITAVRVIETNGAEIIAVRRVGLSDDQKRRLAIADNRSAELAEWDIEQLAADVNAGIDLSPFFRAPELDALMSRLLPAGESLDDVAGQGGAPADDIRQETYGVLVSCGSAEQQKAVVKELTKAGHVCKAVTS